MYDKTNLDIHDRSISSLRTYRSFVDDDIFWFRDDLHQPFPISPLGMTTVQKHHAWGYHVGAAVTQLPPTKGGFSKIYKGRVYLGFATLHDQKEIELRAVEFGRNVERVAKDWDGFYKKCIDEVKENLSFMGTLNDNLSDTILHAALRRAEKGNKRNWELHFIMMYLADVLYFEFENFCKQHDLAEKDFTGMLKGLETMATRTDTGLWNLARRAERYGLTEIFEKNEPQQVLGLVAHAPNGATWLNSFHEFMDIYGHRIVAAHLDVMFPTWIEDPAPAIQTIKTYIGRVKEGWDIREERAKMLAEAKAETDKFAATLSEEDRDAFYKHIEIGKKIYMFQEDHGFYIDGASCAYLHDVAMVCGRRLQKYGLLQKADDVFFLTYHELDEILEGISQHKEAGIYHYTRLVHSVVPERKDSWQQVSLQPDDAPLTMGKIPEKTEDPILMKVFGMVDEMLNAGKIEEIQIMDKFEGYPGSPGVVEGIARVITTFEGFAKLEPGYILVCPYTATAWTPLFPKIKAVVTDTGGMLTHAAITARECKLPAVVGTWRATRAIKDGDLIRVDGNEGVVEILKKADA
ncbi:PEP-utilising enzyme, mobile domain [Syntrophus gentianae]|uniref:PEP-utilising enzyme, mobile domain n=1 Tax=Syntrophus gentianae TaxID=43775 RepID=A0A1H7VRG7_9BACT|nr:PEP-utilising enzyme, mobile domain [Syntrophus gentianae]